MHLYPSPFCMWNAELQTPYLKLYPYDPKPYLLLPECIFVCLIDSRLSLKSHAQTSHSLWLSRWKLAFFKWHPHSFGKKQPYTSLSRSSASDPSATGFIVQICIMDEILSPYYSFSVTQIIFRQENGFY